MFRDLLIHTEGGIQLGSKYFDCPWNRIFHIGIAPPAEVPGGEPPAEEPRARGGRPPRGPWGEGARRGAWGGGGGWVPKMVSLINN